MNNKQMGKVVISSNAIKNILTLAEFKTQEKIIILTELVRMYESEMVGIEVTFVKQK